MSTAESETWREALSRTLRERDERQNKLEHFYDRFHEAAKRATAVEFASTPSGSEPLSLEDQLARANRELVNARQESGAIEQKLGSISAVNQRLDNKIRELEIENDRLNKISRDQSAISKVKTETLQHLHDELLVLQIQLNVSEEKQKKLEEENNALVDRWMKKAASEAEKMNDANAFLESIVNRDSNG